MLLITCLFVGLGLVAGCGGTAADVESQPTGTTGTVADNPTTFGPLAVHRYPESGDEALITGEIQITESCVLLTSEGASTLLLWPQDATSFTHATQAITYRDSDGNVAELVNGDMAAFGGGHASSNQVGGSAEDFIGSIDWANQPAVDCITDSPWFVGAVVDPGPIDPSDGGSRPVRLAHDAYLGPDGRLLEIGVSSCNGDPTADVTEDDDVVTIVVESYLPPGDESDGCADVLTVELETALGGRQVVDGLTGKVIDVIGRCPTIRGIGQDASEYLGLIVSEAKAQASEADLTVIVECEDGEVIPPPGPTNVDSSRLWISIDGGVVTSAYRV